MNYKHELKEQIFQQIETLLLSKDFKSISVDSIAKELKISKRTIYEIFNSKDEIWKHIVNRFYNNFENQYKIIINNIKCNKISFVDGMIELMKFISNNQHIRISEIFVKFPDIALKIQKIRTSTFQNLIDIAIQNNLVRKDLNINLYLIIIQSSITAILNPNVRREYNINDLYSLVDLYDIIHNGVLTNKGKEEFQVFKNKTLAI